jgi:ABC-type Na+ efflux pump permease subunit
MTFLPVVERELRVTARRSYTYWTRFFAASATLVMCIWIWGWLTEGQAAHQRGMTLFQAVAGLCFVYSLLAGINITADCLSEEKREGTLGLLFLTDLRSYDVVLGKLAATSLNAVYRLFSVFPILAVSLLMGALTLSEFWRMTFVLTNTLFFSLAIGMFVSAISVQERRAMLGTFLVIVLVTAGPPLLGLVQLFHDRSVPYNQTWLLSSAVYPWILAFDAPYKLQPDAFWSAALITHLCGWGFLAAAAIFVRHAWQDRPAVGPMLVRRERWRSWQFGRGSRRVVYRRRLLDINPILWLAGRDRLRTVAVLAVLTGLGLIWIWLYRKQGASVLDPTVYFLTAYCLHTILKLWLASEACRPLAEERRNGTLELLLSTPLSLDEILDGEMLALQRQFGWPVVLVLCADLVMLIAGMREHVWDTPNDWLVLFLAVVAIFIVDLYTLAWVGLWLSLNARKANRALLGTVARVLVLPWAILVIGLSLVSTMPVQTPALDVGETGLLLTAFVVALVNDAVFFTWARTNLREQFRLVATQRFQSKSESAVETTSTPADHPMPPVLAR